MSVVLGYNLLEPVNVIIFSFQLSSAKRDLAFASFPALFDTFFTFAIGCLFSRACYWLHIVIGDAEIDQKSEITLLGVTLDDQLTYSSHISKVCRKASCQTGVLEIT